MGDPRQPSWGEVFDTILTSRLLGVHTAMVGEIRSYSESNQTAEVTLSVQLEAAGGDFETLPPLADVPVLWPGAWTAGDTCLLVFCEESFSKWFDTGSVEPPEVLRRHGLHAVCIPLIARAAQAVQFVALANLVDARLETIRTTWTFPTGVGPSGTAAAGGVPALDSVAASKVKAR